MSAVKTVRDRRAGRGEGEGEEESGLAVDPSVVADADEAVTKDGEAADGSWWTTRAAAVRAWLEANPLEIGVPNDGCLTTIRDQLNRGDKYGTETVRRKCWKHISIELDGVPGWDSASAMPNRTFLRPSQLKHVQKPPAIPNGPLSSPPPVPTLPLPIAIRIDDAEGTSAEDPEGSPRERESRGTWSQSARSISRPPSVVEGPGSLSARTSAEDSRAEVKKCSGVDAPPVTREDLAPGTADRAKQLTTEQDLAGEVEEGEAPEEPQKPLSQMTMLERQAYWMQRRRASIAAARAEKDKEDSKFTFKPNTANSKRTFKAPVDGSLQPCPPSGACPSSGGGKPSTGSNSSSSSGAVSVAPSAPAPKARSSKSGSGSSGTSRRSSVKYTSRGEKKDRSRSKDGSKSRSSKSQAPSGSEPSSARPPEGEGTDERHSADTAIRLARRHSDESLSQGSGGSAREEAPTGPSGPSRPASDSPEKSGEEGGMPGAPELVQASADEEDRPVFVPGEFWWKVEGGRGHHRVRDGGEFQMWSIYRKKDKTRDVSGVSMLVGRTEQPPYEEKVIQMMWDVEVWTEEAAFKWWHDNKHRYVTADKGTGRLVVGATKRTSLSEITNKHPARGMGGGSEAGTQFGQCQDPRELVQARGTDGPAVPSSE